MDIRMAPKLAMRNKSILNNVTDCACYHCCTFFQTSDIKEWVDKGETALCPNCSIDSVLPIYEDSEKDLSFLSKVSKYWFSSSNM